MTSYSGLRFGVEYTRHAIALVDMYVASIFDIELNLGAPQIRLFIR